QLADANARPGGMGQATPALSLPAVAQTEETAWRRGMDMIDALAYVDVMGDDDKARVEQLIQEEMAGSGKRASDYMSELPPLPPSRFAADSALSRALEGAAAGESLSAMDTARYRLDPPPSSSSSSAWRQALDNAHAQLEHQRVRITNLELLLQYGPSAWRMANDGLATTLALTQASIREVEAETLELNRRRKLEQLSAAQDLDRSRQEAEVLRLKCVDIERACRELERQKGGEGRE
ncbi:breast carcinoma amplified sequence 2-like protein, partial [Helicosporidium sp. ATCC 50920]